MYSSIYQISGTVLVSAEPSAETSLGTLEARRHSARRQYDRRLQGLATMAEVGETSSSQTATIPSWTQAPIGKFHAYVIPALSSSQHEVTSVNVSFSGTQAIESTDVSASSSLYYEKNNRFQKIVYKLSASALITGSSYAPSNIIFGQVTTGSSIEFAAPRGGVTTGSAANMFMFHPVSGSYFRAGPFHPAEFFVDVQEYGKIRDIKVWVELVHDIRSGPGVIPANPHSWGGTGDTQTNPESGLQSLQIALRSPNVQFKYAHPMWNDKSVVDNMTTVYNLSVQNSVAVPDILRSSYLLWEGYRSVKYLGNVLGLATQSFPDVQYGYVGQLGTGSYEPNLNLPQMIKRLSMDVGSDNVPQVAFTITRQYNNGEGVMNSSSLVYSKLDGPVGQYMSSSVQSFVSSSQSTQIMSEKLIVDSNNLPRISYCITRDVQSTPNYKIYYSYMSSSLFETEIVENSASIFHSHMALDSQGIPVIAFYSGSTQDSGLYLSRRQSAGQWTKNKIAPASSSPTVIDQVKLAYDRAGNLHILKQTYDVANLKLDQIYIVSSSTGMTYNEIPDYGTLIYGPTYMGSTYFASQNIWVDSSGTFRSIGVTNGLLPGMQTFSNICLLASSSLNGWSSRILTNAGVDDGGQFLSLGAAVPKKTNDHEYAFVYNDDYSLLPLLSGTVVMTQDKYGLSKRRFVTYPSTDQNRQNSDIVTDYLGNVHFIFQDDKQVIRYYATTGSIQNVGSYSRVIKGSGASSSFYQSFDTDIDIRTVFDDSSSNLNPRNNLSLLRGNSTYECSQFKIANQGQYPSPSSASLLGYFKYQNTSPVFDTAQTLTGSNIPWMLDTRIPPGFLYDRNYNIMTMSDGTTISSSLMMTPPPGWLTGPSGTANTNEFPTYGLQLGPATIQPMYPILEDLYVVKKFDQPALTQVNMSTTQILSPNHGKIVGFRPGLRGTEVHGRWKLLIGSSYTYDDSMTYGGPVVYPTERGGFWFRQMRVEFIVDTGQEPRYTSMTSSGQRFKKAGSVHRVIGDKRLIGVISGSTTWDVGTNYVYTTYRQDFGRTYKVTTDLNSPDFSVFSTISGAFYDILSSSGKLDSVMSTFIDNEFGTPYIPLSSGSALTPLANPYTAQDISVMKKTADSVLNPQTLIPRDNTLMSTMNRAGTTVSMREEILKKILEE